LRRCSIVFYGSLKILKGSTDVTSTNYTLTYNSNNFSITKANATIVITPYSAMYDGLPHTASGVATGVT
jgi:hypothetical protein